MSIILKIIGRHGSSRDTPTLLSVSFAFEEVHPLVRAGLANLQNRTNIETATNKVRFNKLNVVSCDMY